MKLAAFEAWEQLMVDLREAGIDAVVVQNPFRMGYEAVRAVGMKVAGQCPAAEVESGFTLVVRGNLETPEIRQ